MENKESSIITFLKYTFVPFIIVGTTISKNKKSPVKGIFAGVLSFIIMSTVAIGVFTDSENESSDNASYISELEKKISTKEIEIDSLEKTIEEIQFSEKEVENDKKDDKEVKEEVEKVEEKKEEIKNYTFGSGNFKAGKDFQAGTYDISIISGQSGNVISDNQFAGGINAILGTDKSFAEQEYKNIELPKDTTLTISGGIEIKLTKK